MLTDIVVNCYWTANIRILKACLFGFTSYHHTFYEVVAFENKNLLQPHDYLIHYQVPICHTYMTNKAKDLFLFLLFSILVAQFLYTGF